MNRRFNIAVTVIISLAFVALGAVFWQSYLRFGEACRDFGLSVAYYFCELFGVEYVFTPTVTEYSAVMQWYILLPSDFVGFTDAAGKYFSLLISGENFSGYWSAVGRVLGIIAKVLIIALPCVLLFVIIVWAIYRRSNTKHNYDTLPLRIFKRLAKWTYQPVKRAVRSYLAFLRRQSWIIVCWAFLLVFHLNLASVAIGFFEAFRRWAA